MSLPYSQQEQMPPPAPASLNEQSFNAHHGRGSFGPVIVVLAVILILGIFSAMIGRLCSGGKIPGLRKYDFEGWFSSKFRSYVDGRPEAAPSSRAPQANGAPTASLPIIIPIEEPHEKKTPRKSQRQSPEITEL